MNDFHNSSSDFILIFAPESPSRLSGAKNIKLTIKKAMKKRISTLLCLLALAMTSMQAKDYNVKDFGAIGNGKVLDHHAINLSLIHI